MTLGSGLLGRHQHPAAERLARPPDARRRRAVGRHTAQPWRAGLLIEFWAVATRPTSVNGLGFSPSQAEAEAGKIESLLTVLPDSPLIGRFAVKR